MSVCYCQKKNKKQKTSVPSSLPWFGTIEWLIGDNSMKHGVKSKRPNSLSKIHLYSCC